MVLQIAEFRLQIHAEICPPKSEISLSLVGGTGLEPVTAGV
jgi:hypothetical protein